MTQPEALRLADAIDPLTRKNLDNLTCAAAAAELRHLHAENEKFRKHIEGQNKELGQLIPMAEKLERQRDALLEALKYHQEQTRPIQKSIDAIKAAEENT